MSLAGVCLDWGNGRFVQLGIFDSRLILVRNCCNIDWWFIFRGIDGKSGMIAVKRKISAIVGDRGGCCGII